MSLQIAVCIKQVPLSSDVRLDTNGQLIRAGKSVINAFDLRALALAVNLKRRHGAKTAVVTMGPPGAREALDDALRMGIDAAFHVEGVDFAGADTLATSRVLAAWLRQRQWDLILFGKQSLDSDTGQVGPQVAELLGLPQVIAARRVSVLGAELDADSDTDAGFETVRCSLPAVVSCAERLNSPIKLPPRAEGQPLSKAITSLGLIDLGLERRQTGLLGSPTRVLVVRPCPARNRENNVIASGCKGTAEALLKSLMSRGALLANRSPSAPVRRPTMDGTSKCDIWVFCEHCVDGTFQRSSLNLLSHARLIADWSSSRLTAVAVSQPAQRDFAPLASCGADRALLLEIDPGTLRPSAESTAMTVAACVMAERPCAVLVSGTEWARAWMPRVAARAGLGLVGDAIGFKAGLDGQLVVLKPALGDRLIAEITSNTRPLLATVRPGSVEPTAPVAGHTIVVDRFKAANAKFAARVVHRHYDPGNLGEPIEGAERVVGIGAGIPVEFMPAINQFSSLIGAALGGTRRACDAQLLPRSRQIGLTGKMLRARLYIGFGISGSPNHTVALDNVDTVVAVNSDPDAAIFRSADFSIVARAQDILPNLSTAFRNAVS